MKNKILSLVLTICMLSALCLFPVNAGAEEYIVKVGNNAITEASFFVSTDTISVSNFEVFDGTLSIELQNHIPEDINVEFCLIEFDEEGFITCITYSQEMLFSEAYTRIEFPVSEYYALYILENSETLRMYMDPFLNLPVNYEAETGKGNEPLCVEYDGEFMSVYGRIEDDCDEVSISLTEAGAMPLDALQFMTVVPVHEGYYHAYFPVRNLESSVYNINVFNKENLYWAELVLSGKAEVEEFLNELAEMDFNSRIEYFEREAPEILEGFGICSDRPEDTTELYEKIAELDFSRDEVIDQINELIAVFMTKEKGLLFGMQNYDLIFDEMRANEDFSYVEEYNLFARANTLIDNDYKDIDTFRERLAYAFKLAIFKDTPYAVAEEFARKNANFFGFNFAAYDTLSNAYKHKVIMQAQDGKDLIEMRDIFEREVANGQTIRPDTPTGGGSGGAGIIISSETASSGEEITLNITAAQELGMAVGSMLISYDRNMLELVEASFGEVLSETSNIANTDYNHNGIVKLYTSFVGTENITAGGTLMTLTFKVSEDASDGLILPVTIDELNFYSVDEVALDVSIINGQVEVSNYEIGDVSKNDVIDLIDVLRVMQYDVGLRTFNNSELRLADVNFDEEVNIIDALLIQKYDAGLITSFK